MIRHMTYQLAGRRAVSAGTMTFGRLRELNDGGTQRADFHVLAVIDAGPGSVTGGFRRHPLQDRSAVRIPPGAVHLVSSPRWQGTSCWSCRPHRSPTPPRTGRLP